MPKDIDEPLLEILHSGYIGQGQKVEQFEEALGKRFDNRNVLTLNSATSGLQLALHLANIKPGDTVLSTPMTCTATNTPIHTMGAKIKWVDINPENGLIDPLDIERKIDERTKAIVCVDWGGMPCDYDKINYIAKRYSLKVIQDAAHAIGAEYKERKVGTLTDFASFSLQAIKHITTVDGGVLFCDDPSDYKRGKLLRWYGIDRETERKDFRCEEDVSEAGWKYHMNDVAATIGLVQLNHLNWVLARHRENAIFYGENLNKNYYTLPSANYSCNSSFWLYTILLPSEEERLDFMQAMKVNNVMVSQVHARNDKHTMFKEYAAKLPGVDIFVQRQVSIPVHWSLTEKERQHIVDVANQFSETRSVYSKNRVWL